MAGRSRAPGPPAPAEPSQASAAKVPPFAEIYSQYFEFVWSSARRLGVSREAADDVVQEIFMVIHGRLHTLQKPESLRSWIYGTVRRTVSSHRRARRAREASGASFFPETRSLQRPPPTPLDLTLAADDRQLLFTLLEELDEAKREVFMLVELEEMTVPEVAEALEIPLNTAYSRLRSARQAFEEALARHNARSGARYQAEP